MKPLAKSAAGWLFVTAFVCGSSCSSLPRAATNAIGAGAGAFMGHELTEGQPEGALLGAATGVLAGETLNHLNENREVQAYQSGYDKGRSDEVKRLYWVQKNLHRDEFGGGAEVLTPAYYEIPVPEHVSSDGTIIEGHSEIIEVLEP